MPKDIHIILGENASCKKSTHAMYLSWFKKKKKCIRKNTNKNVQDVQTQVINRRNEKMKSMNFTFNMSVPFYIAYL